MDNLLLFLPNLLDKFVFLLLMVIMVEPDWSTYLYMYDQNLCLPGFNFKDNISLFVQLKHTDLREAFQTKKRANLGISPNRGEEGGSSKNQKSPKFQLGKVQN